MVSLAEQIFAGAAPASWTEPRSFIDQLPDGTPADRALAAGLAADRVAYAFLGGYHAACDALMGPAPWPAMCVTENGPPHPRTIECRWHEGHLTGTKTFVTGGPHAQTLHVLAVEPGDTDLRKLVVATVDARASGVSIEPLPPSSFVPEVPHGRVVFDNAPADRVVVDGWSAYVKPFRTVEDIHVNLAVVTYLARAIVRCDGSAEDIDTLAAVVHALHALCTQDPKSPATHRSLSGAIAMGRSVSDRLELPNEEGERWQRDRRLLSIAEKARDARRQAAWAATKAA